MKFQSLPYLLVLLFTCQILFGQKTADYEWKVPAESVIRFEGQGWSNTGYQRFPDKAKGKVRDAVWSLSKSSAGLSIRLESDADSISVQYQVDGNLAMPHMPATGVSGIDLYVRNGDSWLWCRGKYQFNDTIQYDFKIDKLPNPNRNYELYFPLYNNIKTLKIGVPSGSTLKFLPARTEKPIVIYGTSIAQGACASRPGMAWTNILSRKINHPVVNLGFSGNGRLEPEVIDLINEIDASVFVLDCLPNLSPNEKRTKEEIQKRIRESIARLQGKHAETPILLIQHAGYSDGLVDSERKCVYESLNGWTAETFESLKKEGIKNLFMLTTDEIGLSNDAFVDGTHPTDLGMEQYANAYEEILRPLILKSN